MQPTFHDRWPPHASTSRPPATHTSTTALRIRRKLVYMRGLSEFTTQKITVFCRCPFGRNLFQHTTARLAPIMWSSSPLGCPAYTGWLPLSSFSYILDSLPTADCVQVVNPGMCDDCHLKNFHAEAATSFKFCRTQRVPFVALAPIAARCQVDAESFVCLKVETHSCLGPYWRR